jgi:hypothetical protein
MVEEFYIVFIEDKFFSTIIVRFKNLGINYLEGETSEGKYKAGPSGLLLFKLCKKKLLNS